VTRKWHSVTTGGKSSFLDTWICLLTCESVTIYLRKGIAKPSVLEDNCFQLWDPSSISEKCFVLKSRYVVGLSWLHNGFGWLKSDNWKRILVWEGMSSFQILLGMTRRCRRIFVFNIWRLQFIVARRDSAALLTLVQINENLILDCYIFIILKIAHYSFIARRIYKDLLPVNK
jgi:hypothetical protein